MTVSATAGHWLIALLALESTSQPQLSIMELVTCLLHMASISASTGHVPSVTPTSRLLVDQNTQVHARPVAGGQGGGTIDLDFREA